MHHLCGLCMHTFIHVGRSISFGRHVWLAIELPCYWLLCFMHASVPDMINVRVSIRVARTWYDGVDRVEPSVRATSTQTQIAI